MSSSDEEPPKFEQPEGHEYKEGEKIYVLDDNKFDIYEAEIKAVKDGKYDVHYPDYPDEDFTAENTERFLPITDANKAIYDEQEEERLKKEEKQKKREERKKKKEEKRLAKKEKKEKKRLEKEEKKKAAAAKK